MKEQDAQRRRTGRTGAADAGHGFDALVVGAGFAGSVMAEQSAMQPGQRVLIATHRYQVVAQSHTPFRKLAAQHAEQQAVATAAAAARV